MCKGLENPTPTMFQVETVDLPEPLTSRDVDLFGYHEIVASVASSNSKLRKSFEGLSMSWHL